MGVDKEARERAAWEDHADPGCETSAASHTGHAPSLLHRWCCSAGPSHTTAPPQGEQRRSGWWRGWGLAVHTLHSPARLPTRPPHPPHVKRSAASETVTALAGAHTRPAGLHASKQSVGEAFVLAITQPSVKTLITTVEQDDTQLWSGKRRFFYFYFLKSEAAVTTQEDPREDFFFVCFLFFFLMETKFNLQWT